MTILVAFLCYVVPTFPLGYVWHLSLFAARYEALGVYRDNPSPPLGLASMAVQGAIFGTVYTTLIAPMSLGIGEKAAIYGALGGLLSWSFTTLAWAAKARLSSIGAFFTIETAFTVVQWVIVGVATALFAG